MGTLDMRAVVYSGPKSAPIGGEFPQNGGIAFMYLWGVMPLTVRTINKGLLIVGKLRKG